MWSRLRAIGVCTRAHTHGGPSPLSYDISGKLMPNFRAWFEKTLHVDITYKTPSQALMNEQLIPDSLLNMDFVHFLKEHRIAHSNRKLLRLNRAHGGWQK
jgi:hypothetical protein